MTYPETTPDIEVNGVTVNAVLDGFKFYKDVALDILRAHDLAEIRPGGSWGVDPAGWYSAAALCAALFEIGAKLGDQVIFQIGQKIPYNAHFPTWMKDIEDAVRSVDIAYHMNHRKAKEPMFCPDTSEMSEGIGHYDYRRIKGENTIIAVCDTPYPCAFDHGILAAITAKFEKGAKVDHDSKAPCREDDGETCTYRITW